MNSLARSQSHGFVPRTDRDLVAELLANKRSPNTCRAYLKDLKDFFRTMGGGEPTRELITQFLQLDRFSAVSIVLEYKACLIARGLSEATVNRRLSALRSLVNHARQVGLCQWSLADVKGEPITLYRDTTGITVAQFKQILQQCDLTTPRGKRDRAILCLLWDNALRRGELVKTNIKDFDAQVGQLTILGKGRGTQTETISLTPSTVKALQTWLAERQPVNPQDPLFTSVSRACFGHRLNPSSIDRLVSQYAKAAGIQKRISPHRLRHSSITAFLDASGGNVRAAQRLSRHAKLDTLQIYDDNRQNLQGEASQLLASLRE
ncbi:MAG: tyrosine-type recombinase/integrase [Jaaginema sp. PMC 1079.18]|nr:tyrosine-type recombinase/integrase [Jaaginema sp. PMC 1080.18]MEC4853461.1 tyrosine-type recombinase/integrase [Jaaginema sp. PMC 1079.18]MEC4868597.1 tyrosine-type recombinase/integrase [Jaaginema sp. PMC 1078.18]